MFDGLGETVRQRRQGVEQRGNGGQVEAVGLQFPHFLFLVGRQALLQLQARLPTGFANVHRQGIKQHLEASVTALQVGGQGQVFEVYRLTVGVAALHLGRIEAYRRALHRAFGPTEPKLAASLQLRQLPLLGQSGGNPLGPVALRQAQVGIDLSVLPLAGTNAATQADRQRLAIGQCQASVQTLLAHAGMQAQAHIGHGHRRLVEGLQGHLAVQHRHALDHLHARQQLLRVQRLVVLHRQALQRPAAVLVFLDTQLQATDLQMGDTHFAGQQAGPHVRHHFHLVQAQGTATLADHDVVGQQYRGKPAPAALKATDMQRRLQRSLGLGFDFGAVFGHQRGEFAPQAHVHRCQYQQQRAQAQAPTGQSGKKAYQTLHVRRPSKNS